MALFVRSTREAIVTSEKGFVSVRLLTLGERWPPGGVFRLRERVPELLPLAHTIGVHGAVVDLEIVDEGVAIEATIRTADRTGVEMEALTSVTVAALAIVDMVKGVDRSAEIRCAKITAKSGGRSGDWQRPLVQLPEWAFEY